MAKKKTLEDLALEFKITEEQIRDSHGIVKKELERERDRIIRKYKKLKGVT
jgi:DNA-directed RNA polymerase sigma subunit (sigma70/sigma32)